MLINSRISKLETELSELGVKALTTSGLTLANRIHCSPLFHTKSVRGYQEIKNLKDLVLQYLIVIATAQVQ